MIDLNRTLFLIDGQSELYAIRERFEKEYGCVPKLATVNCNGLKVSAEGYASKATPFISLHCEKHCNVFICVLDLEGRAVSATKFSQIVRGEILNELKNKYHFTARKLSNLSIKVCVADVMFENWIIADVEGIKNKSKLIRKDAVQDDYEGKSGCNILRKIMTVRYCKTTHSPILFKAIRFLPAKKNSPSFDNFVQALE